jgi:capsular exopolysaccharide synthesis family protein
MADENDPEGDAIDLRSQLDVVRRHKLLIAVTALVAVVLALGLSVTRPKVYRADTEVLLQSRPSEDVLNGNQQQNPQFVQQLVQTELEVMRSRSVEEAVANKLGYTPDVSVAAKGQTQVVVISAEDTSKARAVKEADTYAAVYVQTRRDGAIADLNDAVAQLRDQLSGLDSSLADAQAKAASLEQRLAAAPEGDRAPLAAQRDAAQRDLQALQASAVNRRVTLEDQIDQLQTTATLTQTRGAEIVSKARVPSQPVSPNPRRDGAIALFLGLLVGLGLAFLREYLDDSIRTKDTLDRVTGGLPALALVPALEGWRDRDQAVLESIDHPNSPVAEAYRGLRTSIQFIGIERTVKLVQVTSSSAAEGKSTTSANLAVALARAGKRVVLVDCDLRRPRVHRFFGMSNLVGFTSVLLRDIPASEALVPVDGVPGLNVLPSGPPPPNPSELLGTRSSRDLLRALGEVVDYVIVDSTPLLPVSDSVVLASCVDAVVVVASAGSTTKRSLARSLEMLRLVEAPVVGVVLNRVTGQNAYGYGYGYGYGASATGGDDPRGEPMVAADGGPSTGERVQHGAATGAST